VGIILSNPRILFRRTSNVSRVTPRQLSVPLASIYSSSSVWVA